MVRQEPEHRYIFVIDTEQYAGNFERDLCAYCTGEIGGCGRGDNYAKIFAQEVPEDSNPFGCASLDHRPDDSDHPCRRPCAIWPTPGWYNDGMGGHFRDDLANDAEALAHYIEQGVQEQQKQIDQLERNRGLSESERTSTGWSHDAIEFHLAERRKGIVALRAKTSITKHPAYLSVAIFFYEKPNEAQIAMVKSRALKFPEAKKQRGRAWDQYDITITGFRIIDVVTTMTETEV